MTRYFKHTVYVMSLDLMPGIYKVGYTSKTAAERAESLASALPFDLNVVGEIRVASRLTEYAIHEHFADRRYRGEWFTLTEEDIANILDEQWLREQGLWKGKDAPKKSGHKTKEEQAAEYEAKAKQLHLDMLAPLEGKVGLPAYAMATALMSVHAKDLLHTITRYAVGFQTLRFTYSINSLADSLKVEHGWVVAGLNELQRFEWLRLEAIGGHDFQTTKCEFFIAYNLRMRKGGVK